MKVFKNPIFTFILGASLFSGVVYAITLSSEDISYDNSRSHLKDSNNNDVDNVKDAIDILYTKANNGSISLVPSKEDYIFDGWYDDNNNLISSDSSNIPDTLHAKWKWLNDCSETNKVISFDYTGENESIKLNCSGNYKLEAWGAKGGNAIKTATYYKKGGNGGYASGTIHLESNTTLFIAVGGAGQNGSSMSTDYNGGYNGGGKSYHWVNNNVYSASGGGATHVALIGGQLSEIGYTQAITNQKLLIVAGAGGGAYYANESENAIGGAGGGLEGIAGGVNNTSYNNGKNGNGGTQTAGGTSSTGGGVAGKSGGFGLGGNSSSGSGYIGGSGGGAGLYGGAGSTVAGAGGGSSYIEPLSNATTINGNNSMPTHDGTSTMTGNEGNGYVKITYLG